LPAYKAGGPIRTIANFVDSLGDDFVIRIICKDRDSFEKAGFSGIASDCWVEVGKASVYYLSPENVGFGTISRLISNTPHDILYLNSFFNLHFSIFPLAIRKLKNFNTPVVLAPRGEFSEGALKIRTLKKMLFIRAAKCIMLHNNISWQASSEFEVNDIRKTLGSNLAKQVYIATNIPG